MAGARRILVTVAAIMGLLLGAAGVAFAQQPPPGPAGGALPPGWTIVHIGGGMRLVWQSPRPVPMGDAAVEFRVGERPLGRPVADRDGRTFRLDLDASPGDLSRLEAHAGGRRLDTTTLGRRAGAATTTTLPAPLPVNPVDPGAPGPYRTVTGEYALAGVKLPGFPAAVEMTGTVVAPRGAAGARPLALFLHGRHSTCYRGEEASGDWPCPTGWRPIPSHRGYLQAQRLLASQGYVTVSISANGINGQDWAIDDGGAQARSSLVRHHLGRWAGWAAAITRSGAPAVVRQSPRVDMSRVLLVGHSRGGEGVNRAAIDSLSPPPATAEGYPGAVRWNIRGTVLIGPTIFGHNPAPDVPSVTLLPGCDGDVSDLQGQIYVDGTRGVGRDTALHSAVYMVGANHNFYNTEWTPGQAVAPASDDFGSEEPDRVCSPGKGIRLTARQQQTAGATYVAAAARLFVRGDDRVRPLLDGTAVRAASAGSARILAHAVGGARTPLVTPDASTRVSGAARLCAQVDLDPAVACLDPERTEGMSPHFVPFGWFPSEPGRYAVALDGSGPATVRPTAPASLTGAHALALRLIVPPNTTGTRFDVAVTDTAGRRAVLGQVRVDGLPATQITTAHWAREVRVPVPVRAAADLGRVAALELVPQSTSAQAWLVDAWGWRPGTPQPRPVRLPRIDIGHSTVDEGDSGTVVYQVPVAVSGGGEGEVRLLVVDTSGAGEIAERLVTVRPGMTRIDVPVSVTGNTRFDGERQVMLSAKAVRGTVVGDYDGGVTVRDDDPMPKITITPVTDRVTEGATLTWRMTLAETAGTDVWAYFPALPPASGAELSSTDVDPEWFEWNSGESPLPSRPLSTSGLALFAAVPPGELSTEVTVPTIADSLTEPEEHARFQMMTSPPGAEEPVPGPELTGTVADGDG
jgi:hypothetical protein